MTSKNKIAIFGGTFNPIHLGHINLCTQCAKIINTDEVLLIPTNLPPHKNAPALASNKDRLAMVNIAINEKALFRSCDIEYKMHGKSYTINTIYALKKAYPESDFYLIIGSDMFFMFEQWYLYKNILEEVTLVVGAREPDEYQKMLEKKDDFKGYEEKIIIALIDAKPMSSTDIRQLIKKKDETVANFLDSGVYQYIINNRLYKE